MNIYEMLSFDFKEFVTSPAGILIIVGIICLLVGIIMFLKEGKKGKGPETEKKETVNVEPTPVEQQTQAVTPTVQAPVEPVKVETPVVVPATNDGITEVPVPTVNQTINISDTTPVVPSKEEVKQDVVAPVVESLDTTPIITPAAPVVENLDVAPATEPVPTVENNNVAPVVETTAPVEQPTVYGGANPEVNVAVKEETPREIYGGANPLENTSPIPTTAVNQAYGGTKPVTENVAAPVEQPSVVEPAKEEVEKLEF